MVSRIIGITRGNLLPFPVIDSTPKFIPISSGKEGFPLFLRGVPSPSPSISGEPVSLPQGCVNFTNLVGKVAELTNKSFKSKKTEDIALTIKALALAHSLELSQRDSGGFPLEMEPRTLRNCKTVLENLLDRLPSESQKKLITSLVELSQKSRGSQLKHLQRYADLLRYIRSPLAPSLEVEINNLRYPA